VRILRGSAGYTLTPGPFERRQDQAVAHVGTVGASDASFLGAQPARGFVWVSGASGRFSLWRPGSSRSILRTMKTQMIWETPSFVELRMDAEIGSYPDDFDPTREDPAFVTGTERENESSR
jgi:hypothetical protein